MSDMASRPTHEDILDQERIYMRQQLKNYFALSDVQWEIWRRCAVRANVKETE